jgi:phosphatidylglycerol:prolipoprotein diacylglycerol transferase
MFFYGLFRFITEFFRMPDAHIGFLAFDWLTMGQLLSVPMAVFGLVLYFIAIRKGKSGEGRVARKPSGQT